MTIDNKCKHDIKRLCLGKEFEPFKNILDKLLIFQSNYIPSQTSDVELIMKEYEWTDLLMEIVEFGNKYVLGSSQYRIRMEDR